MFDSWRTKKILPFELLHVERVLSGLTFSWFQDSSHIPDGLHFGSTANWLITAGLLCKVRDFSGLYDYYANCCALTTIMTSLTNIDTLWVDIFLTVPCRLSYFVQKSCLYRMDVETCGAGR